MTKEQEIGQIIAAVILAVLVIAGYGIYSWLGGDKSGESISVKTEAQIASDARLNKVILYGAALKENMREPNSVDWVGIYANDDGSTICFEYRARNGFGGMSFGQTVIVDGQTRTEPSDWNKYCASQPMQDLTGIRRYIPSSSH